MNTICTNTRRTFITAVGTTAVIATSGCLSGGGPVTVTATIDARSDGEEQTLIDEQRTIDDGDFYGWQFELNWDHEIDYTVEVTDGPDVGVYILEDTQLDSLQDGDDFESIEDATWTGVGSVTDTVTLGEGLYWLVVINADREPVNA